MDKKFAFFIIILVSMVHQCLQATPISNEVIQLPELVVSAKRIIPPPEPWRYARIGDVEILSNALDSKTQELVRNFRQYTDILSVIVPALKGKRTPPLKLLICGKAGEFKKFVPTGQPVNQIAVFFWDNEQSFIVLNESDETINVIDELATGDGGMVSGGGGAGGEVSIIDPLASLDDNMDNSGEGEVSPMATAGIKLDLNEQINRIYLRLCYSQMNPQPPAWFEEGMVQLFMRMRFNGNDVTFAEIRGMTARDNTIEAREIQDFNAELARTRLMPFGEFFAVTRDSDAYKGAGTGKWAQQCQAFVHYCLYRRGSNLKEGFAKFVAAATNGPIDEALFKECFKMSYKTMELEIRNYIEHADYNFEKYTFKEDTRPGPFEIRDAKDFEVGRLKGEALRLAGKPEMGRAELLGPYTRKRMDPQLLAALGLDELTQGTIVKGKALLEAAVKGRVVRPRAYVVLGRLYIAEWVEGENAGKELPADQMAKIEGLVMTARTQYPPMSITYTLLADALGMADQAATTQQLAVLVEGCKAYPGNLDLVYKTACLIANSGDKEDARPLVKFGQQSARKSEDIERFEQLAIKIGSAK